jgi:hypothetical protein
MIVRHNYSTPAQALSRFSGAQERALFDRFDQVEMRGFAAYTPCDLQVGSQWFARLGCSELTVALQILEQQVCEASKIENLKRDDVRWTGALDTLDNETSMFSRTAVVYPSNCPQYVEYVNKLTDGVRQLIAEAGKTSVLTPPQIKGRVFDFVPNEVLWAGGIALGIAALYYLGPAVRGLSRK